MSEFYASSIASILNQFNSNLNQGLSLEALQKAKARYGKNEFDSGPKIVKVGKLLKRIFTWQVVMLALTTAGLIALYLTHNNTIRGQSISVISVILLLHILWACLAEFRIHRCTEQIHKHLTISIPVTREGKLEKCVPQDIVPGDIISFSAGNYIPADARILLADGLAIDESALFGTEGMTKKTSDTVEANSEENTGRADTDKGKSAATLPPEQQKNMVFGGTYVEAGIGQAIVVRTGKNTKFWKNRQNVRSFPEADTLAKSEIKSLHNVLKMVGIITAGLAVAIAWGFGYQTPVRQFPLTDWEMLLNLGLLFMLASAPQNAVTCLRLTFSQQARELLKKGVVLRNPLRLERLSRVTAVCANENGLTTSGSTFLSSMFVDEQLVEAGTWKTWLRSLKNLSNEEKRAAVDKIPPGSSIPPGGAGLVLTAALATSEFRSENKSGDDTSLQQAIKENISNLGYRLEKLKEDFPLVNEYSDTSNFGYQMTVFKTGHEDYLNIIFGDAEEVLATCPFILIEGEVNHFQNEQHQDYLDIINYLRSKKNQVYGVASQNSKSMLTPPEMEGSSTFLGFMAFSMNNDEKTKQVVSSSLERGLKIILITENDEQHTVDISKELRLIHTRKEVASRKALEQLTREQLDKKTSQCLAYSNPSPEQRRHIVFSLKRQGHLVGFLGQGNSDLRAMSAADIAFTNAKDASHLVQASSDCLIHKRGFRALRDGLFHAREIYHNLTSSIRWGASCTLSLFLTLVFGTIIGYIYKLPMPMTLVQVAWVQLLGSLLPAVSGGGEKIFFNEKTHRPIESAIFSRTQFLSKMSGLDIFCRAVTISLIAFIPFFLMLWRSDLTDSDIIVARTSVCTTMIFAQFASCWQALRHPRESLFQRMFANTKLLIIFLVAIGLHLIVLYVQPLSQFLEMAPLGWEWQWPLLFSLGLFLLPLNLAINSQAEFD